MVHCDGGWVWDEVLGEMTPLEDTIIEKILENWWIGAVIGILLVLKILSLFKK